MKNYNGCITALMNYNGIIFDMGLEDQDEKPTFYILTEDLKHIRVTISDAMSIVSVCSWLESLTQMLILNSRTSISSDAQYRQYSRYMVQESETICTMITPF